MFRSTLQVLQGDNTSVQATTSTIFTLQEGKVTEPALHLHARTGVPEFILQPSGDTGSMLQIHPGTPRRTCKYEKDSSQPYKWPQVLEVFSAVSLSEKKQHTSGNL